MKSTIIEQTLVFSFQEADHLPDEIFRANHVFCAIITNAQIQYQLRNGRVLTNSKFKLFYSNFWILTPTYSKVPKRKYGKTQLFLANSIFTPFFKILVRTLNGLVTEAYYPQ